MRPASVFLSLLAALFMGFAAPWAEAQSGGVTLSLRADAAPLSVAEPLPGETLRYRLEAALVAEAASVLAQDAPAEGRVLRIAIPGGERAFSFQRAAHRVGDVRSATALAADGSGEIAVLTVTDGRLAGFITDGADVLFLLPDAAPALVRVPASAVPELACGNDEHEHAAGAPARHALHVPFAPALGGGGAHDEVTIDVMIPYTFAAEAWARNDIRYGSIDVVIAQALALSQLALDNSDARILLRLVHSYHVDYDEATPAPGSSVPSSNWHLRRLTASPVFNPYGPDAEGYMLDVHERRDLYGADLVALFAVVNDVGGIAWLLNTLSGSPQNGFSVNRVQQMATGFTLVHEIGHNMGLAHGRDQPTNAASEAGGLFPYAVGWRWTGDNGVRYNSVMSYGQPGDTRAPHFSNPSVTLANVPTGTATPSDPFGPADAARALRESRFVVAGYRLSMTDPPVVQTPEPVSVTAAFGAEAAAAVVLNNTGASGLQWDVDVRPGAPALAPMPPSSALAGLAAPGEDAALAAAGAARAYLAPAAPLAGVAARSSGPATLYATSFEPDEGFATGTSLRHDLWATSGSAPFSVLAASPAVGTQHLRITPPPSGAQFVQSPFLGARPTGNYTVSKRLSLGSTGGPAYFAVIREGQRGAIVGGWAFSGGNVFAYNPAAGNYSGVGQTITAGTYRTFEIVLDPDAGLARYRIDGAEVATHAFVGGGPAQLQFIRNGGAGSDYLDIDDVAVRSDYVGLSWLRLETPYGSAPAGGAAALGLRFPADAAQVPGTRAAQLLVRTNDPARPLLTVPVTYQVASVSAEEAGEAPVLSLQAARPNPFRAEVVIPFSLGAPAHVRLEVFSVTGAHVATLLDAPLVAGEHVATWAPEGLAAGVYVYRLQAGAHVGTGRLLLVR